MASTSTSPIDLTLEESTIDPKSPLPSFLEIILLERASHSARNVLKSIIEALSSHIAHYLREQRARSIGREVTGGIGGSIVFIREIQRNITLIIARIISKLCNVYKLELQFILTYFIEKHVFMTSGFDAAASESLFNFKRSRVYKGNNNYTATYQKQNETQTIRIEPMKKSDMIKASLLLAIIPYMTEKAKEIYEIEKERRRQQQQQQENYNYNNRNNRFNHDNRHPSSSLRIMKKKIRSFVFYIYPFLHLSTEGINTAYYFAYMIGKSVYYDPCLHLLGQVVRRCTIEDLEEKKQNQNSNNRSSNINSDSRIGEEEKSQSLIFNSDATSSSNSKSLGILKSSAATGLCVALCVGWMGQLRRELRRRRRRRLFAREEGLHNNAMNTITGTTTTNTDNHSSSSSRSELGSNFNRSRQDGDHITNNHNVIPPPLPPVITNGSNVNKDPSLCPLCGQTRVNPVASSSGFVFCYRCITMYIRENGQKCPVTGMQCTESQLVRIYESTNSVG